MNQYDTDALPNVIVVGKRPPPMTGTAMWATTLDTSQWWTSYRPIIFDINVNSSVVGIGKMSPGKMMKTIAFFGDFRRILRREKPALIILPISQAPAVFLRDMVFARIAGCTSVPVLLYLHGSAFKETVVDSWKILTPLMKRLLRTARGVVVLGERLKGIFRGVIPDENIFVVYNGVDLPVIARTTIYHRVVFLGNLMRSKGIEDFVEACRIVHSHRSDIKFSIIGEIGDEHAARLVKEISACDFITYTGPRYDDEKYQMLGECDILVFPPREKEGQPMVLIEASAAGMASIATSRGAISETVIDESTGYIVPEFSPPAIAEKILYLYNNVARLQEMQRNARLFYEEHFTERHMVERLEYVIDTLLDREYRPRNSA